MRGRLIQQLTDSGVSQKPKVRLSDTRMRVYDDLDAGDFDALLCSRRLRGTRDERRPDGFLVRLGSLIVPTAYAAEG